MAYSWILHENISYLRDHIWAEQVENLVHTSGVICCIYICVIRKLFTVALFMICIQLKALEIPSKTSLGTCHL